MNKNDLVDVRGVLPGDTNFILATFLRGLYYGNDLFGQIPKSIFMKEYHKIIENILTVNAAHIKVACLKEDPEIILGYSVLNADNTTLSFVFVKKAWRNIGISKLIVPQSVTTVTHLTKSGLSIAKSKGLSFNPFVI